ncbi:MAG: hypothetical protein WKF58_00160 [Ilumatobacteraceae bacterium]
MPQLLRVERRRELVLRAVRLRLHDRPGAPEAPTAPESPAPAAEPATVPWVVVVEVDPKWYELKGTLADAPLPPANTYTVALHTTTSLIGRTSKSKGVKPDIALDADTGVSPPGATRRRRHVVERGRSGEHQRNASSSRRTSNPTPTSSRWHPTRSDSSATAIAPTSAPGHASPCAAPDCGCDQLAVRGW